MFAIEKYQKAQSVAEAVKMLGADPFARAIAGGTDVLVRLREGHRDCANLVDIHGLPELLGISLESGGADGAMLSIGSGTTFTALVESPLVAAHAPLLAQAAARVAGPQIRNVATIGGNLCNGSVCADSAPPLLVLEAQLEFQGPDGLRRIPLRGFHLGPGKVAMGRAEVLTAIRVPVAPDRDFGAAYEKYAMRRAMDITTIGCAAAVRFEGQALAGLRLAYSVAAPVPVRCPAAEAAAKGKPFSKATLDAVAQAVEADVTPRTSWRASKEFRMHIIRELARRVITQAAAQAGRSPE